MLYDFLLANSEETLARARKRVAKRSAPVATEAELTAGLPVFLDQLVDALRLAVSSRDVNHESITKTARQHGSNLLHHGFTVAQVVHDYGDLCQVITELAVEQNAAVSTAEFRTLNLCLDDAIAGAVTEYSQERERSIGDAGRQRERTIRDEGVERLGSLAHEMRNLLGSAMLAFDSIKKGIVAPGGSTSMLLARSLMGLQRLVDRSLADVRLDVGITALERVAMTELVEEVEIWASAQAKSREIELAVTTVDSKVVVEADRQILSAAVANLLHNAFKFTPKKGHVSLIARTTADRVLIEVEDECGGLPPGKVEELFRPFAQRGKDRTGLGLGLSICLKAVKAMQRDLRVRDVPGKGCVFTIDLPKQPPLPATQT
jgi:signal transduction histidine kinase